MSTSNPLAGLVRPRLLAAAAREGARIYRRERDLAGVLPGGRAAGRGLLAALRAAEAALDAARRAQAPEYSVARHVRLLAALLAEARGAAATGAARAA